MVRGGGREGFWAVRTIGGQRVGLYAMAGFRALIAEATFRRFRRLWTAQSKSQPSRAAVRPRRRSWRKLRFQLIWPIPAPRSSAEFVRALPRFVERACASSGRDDTGSSGSDPLGPSLRARAMCRIFSGEHASFDPTSLKLEDVGASDVSGHLSCKAAAVRRDLLHDPGQVRGIRCPVCEVGGDDHLCLRIDRQLGIVPFCNS